jgi:hypothetical protein
MRSTPGPDGGWRLQAVSVADRLLLLGDVHAGGLTDQVVPLRDVRGPTGSIRVRRGGGTKVSAQLVQVAADGVRGLAPVAAASG